MEHRNIVAVVIENNGAYLLLKRAPYMKYQGGYWSVCAGTIEQGETPEQAAVREAMEETKLSVKIVRTGKEFETIVGDRKLTVFSVLAIAESRNVIIDSEHSEFKWIKPQELWDYRIVPLLEKDFECVGVKVGKPAQKKLF